MAWTWGPWGTLTTACWDGGKSILLISADLDEVRSLSDRLAVIYGGRIVAEGKPDTWSDMEIGLLMTGGSLAPEKEGTA